MSARVEVGYMPGPHGGEVVVARCVDGPFACRATVPVADIGDEVGAAGNRLRDLARRAASSKALRRVARTALGVAQATPYGRAASAAARIARTASRAARRPTSPRRAPESTHPVQASTLTDAQRVELARRLLATPKLPPQARLSAMREVLS